MPSEFTLTVPVKESMSYSIQLYTLRDAVSEDLPGAIKRVAEIGFTKVEPYDFVATAKELGPALRENGLTAPSGHAPLLSQDQDEIFSAAKELGISTVIDPMVPAELWQDASTVQDTAAKLNAAAKKGAEYGIRVGYHNHAWELESIIDGQTALEYFESLLDPEVVLEVDTYWAAVGGQDPVELLERLGDRVKFIHIQDGPLTKDNKAQQPAGQGKVAVLDVIAAATSLEVGVVEFDDYAGDIFEGITQSLDFLASAPGSAVPEGAQA
jgi:sugar phosphate isomerase/epimerase